MIFEQAREIKDRHAESLMRLPEVAGLGIGCTAYGVPCIRVYLREAVSGTNGDLPVQLNGILIESEIVGEAVVE